MKIVKESLNEVISFKRGGDPLSTLGIGRKQMIEKWLYEMNIRAYIINNDLSINVKDDVLLSKQDLKEIPEYIQFNEINGYFNCNNNYLTSLRGCPFIVKGPFFCSRNNLISLEGCPKKVNSFYCINNKGIKFTKKDVLKYCNVVSGYIKLNK